MITSEVRTAVSLVTILLASSATLTLGACRSSAPPVTWNGPNTTSDGQLTIDFENEAMAPVDVYLVGELREFRLGRVAPGARAQLRVPAWARTATSAGGFVWLSVLPGAPYSAQAAREPRAITTIARPFSDIVAQRWTFRPQLLMSAEVFGTKPE